jgi:D-alanyl-lipoteichoic acid acyltransferase DltB (MBOAT superfamily)
VLFNSLTFCVFLPVVLLLVSRAGLNRRNWILLGASYVFYGAWDWRFLALLMGSTVVDYTIARLMDGAGDSPRRKTLLAISMVTNLTVLGFFEYFNFFVGSAVDLVQSMGGEINRPALQIILPVGISFYTLQAMSYTIDVYWRRMPAIQSLRDFALYVAYFPQLVAGPIERATALLPQIQSPGRVTPERINMGLMLMIVGFTKKVLIADSVANITGPVYSNPEAFSAGELIQAAYLYTFQIYCDFSGYSDIARGVSELLGIRLMQNFLQPYLSQSVTEFWRRWHISLSSWLRDYLYIPLGGSRRGEVRTYANVLLTWLICGLWHGAAWTFVVWGGLNGVYIAIERFFGIARTPPVTPRGLGQWVKRLAATGFAFHLIVVTFIIFPSPTFADLWHYLSGIAALDNLGAIGVLPLIIGLAVLLIDIPQNVANDDTVFLRLPWWLQSPLYASLIFAMLLYGERDIPFIYFQF